MTACGFGGQKAENASEAPGSETTQTAGTAEGESRDQTSAEAGTAESGTAQEAGTAAGSEAEVEIPETPYHRDDGGVSMDVFAMDTYMTLLAYGDNAEEAILAAAEEIHSLDALLSTGSAESEISELNAAGGGEVSPVVKELIERSQQLYKETGGLFDIAIYPIMKLWGFPTQEYRVPEQAEIDAALKLANPSAITLETVGEPAAQTPAAQTPAAGGTGAAAAPEAAAAPAEPAQTSAKPAEANPSNAEAAPAAAETAGSPAGQEAAPVADKEAAPAPAEKEAAPASSEKEAAPASSEKEAAPAPAEKEAAPASSEKEAAPAGEKPAPEASAVPADPAIPRTATAASDAGAAAGKEADKETAEAEPAESKTQEKDKTQEEAKTQETEAAPAAEAPADSGAATPAAETPAAQTPADSGAAAPAAETPAAQAPAENQTAVPGAENPAAGTSVKATYGIPGMEIDLGGIAKGYTSARVMEIFREHGIKHGLVSLGGNVQAIGPKEGGDPWRVAIQNPESELEYLGVLEIEDKCVITSGGYERFFDEGGKRYHHIIDPRTGYPADSGIISATIISEDGALADGLSTSLFIMGKDEAEKYWQAHSDTFDYILEDAGGTLYVTEDAKKLLTTEKKTVVIKKTEKD